jgi:hypothetical protein
MEFFFRRGGGPGRRPGGVPADARGGHTDGGERAAAAAELDGLFKRYPPKVNKYAAPNGKPSKLNHAQWYAVRTKNFKEWFGNRESAARADKLGGGVGSWKWGVARSWPNGRPSRFSGEA